MRSSYEKDRKFIGYPSSHGPHVYDTSYQHLYDSVFVIFSVWYIQIQTKILHYTQAQDTTFVIGLKNLSSQVLE